MPNSGNDSMPKMTKFRQYLTTFTPLGEPEKGKMCPSCKVFLEINRFRSTKGTRGGVMGTIRNNKCRICEDGIRKPKTFLSNTEEDINKLNEQIEYLKDENANIKKIFNGAMDDIDTVFDIILKKYDINLKEIKETINSGQEVTLKKKSSLSKNDEPRSGELGSRGSWRM
jgi:hypothetical protein